MGSIYIKLLILLAVGNKRRVPFDSEVNQCLHENEQYTKLFVLYSIQGASVA